VFDKASRRDHDRARLVRDSELQAYSQSPTEAFEPVARWEIGRKDGQRVSTDPVTAQGFGWWCMQPW